MSDLAELVASLEAAVHGAADPALEDVRSMSAALQRRVIEAESVWPAGAPASDLDLSRRGYEAMALLAIRGRDEETFLRLMHLLHPYYFDYRIPENPRQSLMLGLLLMYHVTKGQPGDFHAVLEAIDGCREGPMIRFAIEIGSDLAEGRYNRIWEARDRAPDPSYLYFIEMLAHTARRHIKHSICAAYDTISVEHAINLLHLENGDQLAAFIRENNLEEAWVLDPATMTIRTNHPLNEAAATNIDPPQLIKRTLAYAHEIERII